LFTNNVLNEEQLKQIKEIGDKDVNFPAFDSSKMFNKPNNNWFNINSPQLFDKMPSLANFRNDIKLFNEIPKPRINFNVEKKPDNNLNQKEENENDQKNKNELPLTTNNDNVENKNENQIENSKNNNEIKMPNFPSFFSDNKDNIIKNKNLEIPVNTNINNLKIGNTNLNDNPLKNNNNKLNMLLNYMKPPTLINNIYSNFMSDYKLSLDNFLFPNNFGSFPFNPNLKSNLILNSLNNKLNYFPLNMMAINNEINKNRIENNLLDNINLLGNKRI
jgi:hypothetical protein